MTEMHDTKHWKGTMEEIGVSYYVFCQAKAEQATSQATQLNVLAWHVASCEHAVEHQFFYLDTES